VLVLCASLREQNATPSRTDVLSGASPDFPAPKPLSGRVLITRGSVHFQDFQALQALGRSCSTDSPHGHLHAFAPGGAGGFTVRPVSPSATTHAPPLVQARFMRGRGLRHRSASSRPAGLHVSNRHASAGGQGSAPADVAVISHNRRSPRSTTPRVTGFRPWTGYDPCPAVPQSHGLKIGDEVGAGDYSEHGSGLLPAPLPARSGHPFENALRAVASRNYLDSRRKKR
jgi:hypothetical protein